MNNTALINQKGKIKKKNIDKKTVKIITFILLIVMSLTILLPFYIIIITSFKHNREAIQPVFTWWPTQGFSLEGYLKVLFEDKASGMSQILRGFMNTFIVIIPPTVIGLFTSSLSAYAFAKMKFPAKKFLFTVLLFTMMIPGIVMLIPSYLLYDQFGLVDTFFPLMAPGMFGAAACVFFMRQYFYGIPSELVESAKIDGLNHFMIFWRIMVPLSASGLIAQGVLGFVGGYNDYMGPLMYLQSPDKYTLQIALKMSVSTYGSDWQTVMAGSVIALIPTLLLYIFAQKFFIEGIATTGLKA